MRRQSICRGEGMKYRIKVFTDAENSITFSGVVGHDFTGGVLHIQTLSEDAFFNFDSIVGFTVER